MTLLDRLWHVLSGSKKNKWLKIANKRVVQIADLEQKFANQSDEQISQWATALKPQWSEEVKTASADKVIQVGNEIYAAIREMAKRKLNMRHYDCQIIGGMVLEQGAIAEMKTGEGKTLVATLALIANACAGKKAFLVTVNDYLARRDAEWMRPLYEAMGLTVGIVSSESNIEQRQAAYQCDIIYITNNELGFDFLRDRMAFSNSQQIQPSFDFAIVDEVDSILIDEARTPLIISAPADQNTENFKAINSIIPKLDQQIIEIDVTDKLQQLQLDENDIGDYWVDEKNKQVELTEKGHGKVEQLLIQLHIIANDENLYAPKNLNILQMVNNCLRANTLFKKDVDYIISEDEIILIDENTGRLMKGRRLSGGLHQAIECKENVMVRRETQTLASTTFQNFFRLFSKLSGMTGTAITEAIEFEEIYQLSAIPIPTNKPLIREDANDAVFMSEMEKYEAIANEIQHASERNIPILVGTASVESSEKLSKMLKNKHIKHEVLNAKNHAREAEIIAQAGVPGKVTISTNMAGRGTDIILGGNPDYMIEGKSAAQAKEILLEWEKSNQQVIQNGGLYVLGCERHESRRTDNQLRGRAGRQGDPGASRFFLSMEDSLIRLFVTDRVRNIMMAMGIEKGDAIEHKMLSNAIERAQKKVEQRNFEIRKNLLDYDNVANEQRSIVYEIRDGLLHEEDIAQEIQVDLQDFVQRQLLAILGAEVSQQQMTINLVNFFELELGIISPDLNTVRHEYGNLPFMVEFVMSQIKREMQRKYKGVAELQSAIERHIKLQTLDQYWRDHLQNMELLRSSINLRAYAQRNPKQEYKREAFLLFSNLMDTVRDQTIRSLLKVQINDDAQMQEKLAKQTAQQTANQKLITSKPEAVSSLSNKKPGVVAPVQTVVRQEAKVGRNELCPCGSGKKYKKCHGMTDVNATT